MTNPPEYTDDELREFDELTRKEAAERGESYTSPFDAAAAAAAPAGGDAPAEQLQFGELPKKREKKKKSSTGAKRGRRPKNAAAADAPPKPRRHVGPIPPAPAAAHPPAPAAAAAAATPSPIPAAQLIPLVKRLDAMISARAGTDPLTDAEAAEGASVLSPVLHHYLPSLVNSNQPWVPAAVWVALTYGPRAIERASAPTQRDANRTMREVREAQPASTASTFQFDQTPPADGNPPHESDIRPPLAKKDPFWNELDNQPDTRPVPALGG